MNKLVKTTVTVFAAAGIVLGGASVASAKPAVCADISVPVKVRLAEGCFLPDSSPALPPGESTGNDSPFSYNVPTDVPEFVIEVPQVEPPAEEAPVEESADAPAADVAE
jgi:hypothetical protein